MRIRHALTGVLTPLTLTLASTGIATADDGQSDTPPSDPLVTEQTLNHPSDNDTTEPSESLIQPFKFYPVPETDGSNSICTNTLTGKKTVISMARAYQCHGWVDLRNAQNKNVGRVYGYHLPAPGSKSGISCKLVDAGLLLFSLFGPGGASLGWASRGAIATMGLWGISTCK